MNPQFIILIVVLVLFICRLNLYQIYIQRMRPPYTANPILEILAVMPNGTSVKSSGIRRVTYNMPLLSKRDSDAETSARINKYVELIKD